MIPNMGRDDSLYQPPEQEDMTEIADGCGHETDLVVGLTQRGRNETICRYCALKVIQLASYDPESTIALDIGPRCQHCRKFECVCP